MDWGEKMMSKEHAKEILENLVNNEDVQSMLLRTDIDAIKCAISALSEVNKGEWRWVGENSFGSRYMCNRCNYEQIGRSDTCPNCRADMRGEAE